MTGQHPRLRAHTRRRKSGKVVTYYVYDRRPEGLPDVALGRDYDGAVLKWRELHEHKPRLVGTVNEAIERWEAECLPEYKSDETRKGYASNLRKIKPAFGPATWGSITLPVLAKYLQKRSGKTQANRELSLLSIIWNKARLWGMTALHWPAAGMARSKWKNKESARIFEVTDELFAAVYAQGNQTLRDCMDLASATGMRLTDCRQIAMPAGDLLRLRANKTGKPADFDLSLSTVLPALIERRRSIKAAHRMLLSTPTGKPVSARMLRTYYDEAQEKAAKLADEAGQKELAEGVRAMFLRDLRKRAADLAESDEAASTLLQHSGTGLTKKHYRTKVQRLRPTR